MICIYQEDLQVASGADSREVAKGSREVAIGGALAKREVAKGSRIMAKVDGRGSAGTRKRREVAKGRCI